MRRRASFFGVSSQTSLEPQRVHAHAPGRGRNVRAIMNWAAIDPGLAPTTTTGGPSTSVVGAARERITVLPFIFATPTWVATDLDNTKCKGTKCSIYAPCSARQGWPPGTDFIARRGRPLRSQRPVLDRQPEPAEEADPRLADLERDELEQLLPAEASARRGTRSCSTRAAGRFARGPGRGHRAWRHGRRSSGSQKAITGWNTSQALRVGGAKSDFDGVADPSLRRRPGQGQDQVLTLPQGDQARPGHQRRPLDDRDRLGIEFRRQPAQPGQEGPGEAPHGGLPVLRAQPSPAEREDGRLVLVEGLALEHLRLVCEVGAARPAR